MQLDLLKEEIRNEYLDHTEIIRHVIYPELGGESIPLSELESYPDWEEIFLPGCNREGSPEDRWTRPYTQSLPR
jgi:hypothetical protein